jgi:hypothetical protein
MSNKFCARVNNGLENSGELEEKAEYHWSGMASDLDPAGGHVLSH